VRELGRGGMGVVYEALGQDGRRVALKTLLNTATPHARERFRREAEGQARADGHRNVVRIHSVGAHAGLPYLVTELLTGGTLTERIKRGGRLEPAEAVEVVSALADGLAYAHAQGILHRDIKPANVLFDESGTPKLADFGLAKLPDAQTLTQTGHVMGTVGYMAPEMIDDARRAEPSADVFSLGALLFTCLAGRPPLKAGTELSRMLALLREPAPLLRTQRPDVPEALEQICARALERDPAARFPSAASMAEALRGAVSEPAPERSREWRGLVLGGLVLSGLIVSLAAAFTLASPPPVAKATPTPEVSASQPTVPELTWRLPERGELRYRVRWKETGFNKSESRADSVLVLLVQPLSERARQLEVRWEFSEFASYRDEQRAAFVPKETLDLAKDIVVFKGVLDLVTGSWTVRQTPAQVQSKIQKLVDPDLASLQGTNINTQTDTAHWAGTWAFCFFHAKPLPRLLEVLFSPGPLERTPTRWRKRPGLDRVSANTSGGQVIYPYLWAVSHAQIQEFGERRQVKVDGERFREEGLPRSLNLTQVVTLPDGTFAEDVLEFELLP
jgi:serine/threonine protein kinase